MTPKEWYEIQDEYDEMQRMSCVPAGIQKVRADHIFDEDKSVKWNREQVTKNNRKYQQEVARLNTEKNKRRDAIHEDIYRAIQKEVGHGLSRKKAMALWFCAYDKGHAFGIREIKCCLDELMELAITLLSEDKEDKV